MINGSTSRNTNLTELFMKSKYVNIVDKPNEYSGNYNYGLFCGHKDTLIAAKDFVWELLIDKFNLEKDEVKEIISELERRCEF